MTDQAFALVAPDGGHGEDDFLQAWKDAITLSGHPGWFGVHDDLHLQRARRKEQLPPHIKSIAKGISSIAMSQACLIAAMVGFFNPAEGARLASKLDANGIGGLVAPLNPQQRIALGRMLINYRGW